MKQTNLEVVRGIYEALGRGDGPAALGAMHPDLVWNEAEHFPYADRNPYRGPRAVAEGVLGRLSTEWDGFAVNASSFVDGGDRIVVTGRYTGMHKESETAVNAQFAHVWKLRDGKVVSFQQYTDTAQFAGLNAA